MLWNLTYADPDRWREVHAVSGRPLAWWQRSGSPRMRLLDGPPAVVRLLDETSDVKWANFQRTQSGGILYFRVRLEVYGIPFAAAQTTWSLESSSLRPHLCLRHSSGPVLLELSSAPSRGMLTLLEKAFGPQTVSKVHV